MMSASAETVIMNHIKDFVLDDDPIDIETVQKALEKQVFKH